MFHLYIVWRELRIFYIIFYIYLVYLVYLKQLKYFKKYETYENMFEIKVKKIQYITILIIFFVNGYRDIIWRSISIFQMDYYNWCNLLFSKVFIYLIFSLGNIVI